MKKLFFFLPAAVHTAATLCLNVLTGALIPIWHMWNLCFWLSGYLMSRGKVWGFLPGLAPAVMVLVLQWGRDGAAWAVGAVWLMYYLACGAALWRKRQTF